MAALTSKDATVRMEVADDLEEFVRLGNLWDAHECAAMVERLAAETDAVDDPLPARLGRFLEAVSIRMRISDVPSQLRVQIDAIVYPRVWKVIEGIRDGMPDASVPINAHVGQRIQQMF